MKNTVKVTLFLVIVATILYLIDTYMKNISGLFGYFSILISLTVMVIGFVIFLENRHPTQTLTWLIVLGGFIFYLFFGAKIRKQPDFVWDGYKSIGKWRRDV